MASVFLLCAGLGTRLRPLTSELPKPLVPVGDAPLLGHIARALRAAGFRRAIGNTHHLPNCFSMSRAEVPLAIDWHFEAEILGTAGGVAAVRHQLEPGPLLVWNGDILADPPIDALLERARVSSTLCLGVALRPPGEGSVGLGASHEVVRLRGERFGEERCGGDYIGVAGLAPECWAELPTRGCLVGDYALPVLRRRGTVTAVPVTRAWDDLGDVQSYFRANLSWVARHANVSECSWIGPGGTVSGSVRLEQSIIGAGARVLGSGVLARTVVWPGATVTAPLQNAIVLSSGRVVSLTHPPELSPLAASSSSS